MKLHRACWGLVAVLASACNTGDPEYSASLTLSPEKPVVINTPFERKTGEVDDNGNPVTETVSPSWFLADYQVTNNGDSTITVVSMTVTVNLPPAADDTSGEGSTGTCEIAADEESLGRTYLMEVPSKGTGKVSWYCYGFDFPKDVGYATTGTIQLNGWVGTHDVPEKRLNVKLFNFSTQ